MIETVRAPLIRSYDDFLPEDLFGEAVEYISSVGFSYGWQSSKTIDQDFGHWNFNFLDGGGSKNLLDLEQQLIDHPFHIPILNLWLFLKGMLPAVKSAALLRCYMNGMTYGTDGYPHTDSHREGEFTVVLYMNTAWERNWAGETCVWDEAGNEIETAVSVRPGRVLIFPGTRFHRANGVSRLCPALRVTLMYKVRL